MRVKLKTLGCRLNEAELETWARQFQAEGCRIVADAEESDLIVLNSCAVTSDAVRKSRNLIRRAHRENPKARLVVTGCYASLNADEAREALGVDLVVGNEDKGRLVEIASEQLDFPAMPAFSTEPGETSLFARGRQRAFIKVQDGCRYRCTYCIVTVARGEEKSRPIDDIVAEINELHAQGIAEFVLTGVHLGGWGNEWGLRLEDLAGALLERTAIPRLRLGSLEPWELTPAFFGLLKNPRLMPHLHLPLQSGCDAVLRRMARRCKASEFAELVDKARQACPDLNITTDIIVGFPGETEEEWEEGLEFLGKQAFGHLHIFSFSPRSGTRAASLPDPVPEAVKKARVRQLQGLANEQRRSTLSRFAGRDFDVLWEEGRLREDGSLSYPGYTPNYLRVEAKGGPGLCGSIRKARMLDVAENGEYLLAEILS